MKFARLVFTVAGIYGILALFPLYFTEKSQSPPLTHPEFFYGFLGCGLAFQFVFLVMSRDPRRYVALIPAACFEKFSFTIPCVVLFLQQRLSVSLLAAGLIDGVLGVLFVMCYMRLRGK